MANKNFMLDEDLAITVYKRRGSRNLRLSIAPTGQVRVTIPAWAPYSAGINFAKKRQNWIREQIVKPNLLTDGQPIGKAHHLEFAADVLVEKPSSRIKGSIIVIRHPSNMALENPEVQLIAQEACVRALRAQAEQLLPQRLAILAKSNGFQYGSVSVKRLKSRWGSCDQHANIVLNLFLMQLPWELIDYVLLHELTHTEVLRHGPDFWQAMKKVLPDVQMLRKSVKDYQPVLNSIS